MKEIRVRWCVTDTESRGGRPSNARAGASAWHPNSIFNRQSLQLIVDSGNEIHGAHTHWVEEREAELVYQQA